MELTNQQLEFLKQYKADFSPVSAETDYPYVCVHDGHYGSRVEIYNLESVDLLIEEIKANNKILDTKNSVRFATLEGEFYELHGNRLCYIDLKPNRKTGELEIETPIKKSYTPYKISILRETDNYCDTVYRCTGDMGDGRQRTQRIYKGMKAAQAACIPLLIKQKNTIEKQKGYLQELIERYTDGNS